MTGGGGEAKRRAFLRRVVRLRIFGQFSGQFATAQLDFDVGLIVVGFRFFYVLLRLVMIFGHVGWC